VAEIAAVAGRLALARWRGDFKRWEKSPGQIVSDLDIAVDAFLKVELGRLLPDAGWLSEETADDPARLECARVWVVDPIDGTRDFVRGRDGWCVSVALVDRWRSVMGVLDAPARGEQWRAEAGRGATLNGRPVSVARRDVFAGSRVAADSLSREDADLVAVPRPNSIALRIGMVAAGEADLLASLRWGNEWDIAAAALIAAEAGATVTDALGETLSYNTPTGEAFGILATAPGIHRAALERLRGRALAALPR
jgi:myo-inositol-1(or 4)-monophosphatase